MNSSFLLLYFFNLLLSFSLSFFQSFFLVCLSLNPFSYYILWFLHHFLHPCVGQALGVLFLCSPLPLLEPSTLSCKAACSLFKHHLHINAARELAGQHLMRGQQYFQIFFFFRPFLLIFFRIIYYGFYTNSFIHMWVRRWESFLFVLPCLSLNLPFLAVRLLVHCSSITSTLTRPESQLDSI